MTSGGTISQCPVGRAASSSHRTPSSRAKCLLTSVFAAITLALTICNSSLALAQTTAPYLDNNGWTVFTPSADTQIIYVSSSQGSDSNNGRSESTSVKTIAKGLTLIRHGYPDWLLLKRGDTWTDEAFGRVSQVSNGTARSGRSASEPMVFGAYGSGPRPLLKTNPALNTTGVIRSTGGGGGQGGDFLALVDLDFYAYTRDLNSPDHVPEHASMGHGGVVFLNPITWLLIEGCRFRFYGTTILFQPAAGKADTVVLRRNVIANAFVSGARAQGMYSENIPNLLLEENLVDHNGWHAALPATRTAFNQNIYIQGDSSGGHATSIQHGFVTARRNIIARASANGIQGRAGGVGTDNLFIANPINGFMSNNLDPAGPPSRWENNVALHGVSVVGVGSGWGLQFNSFAHNSAATGNIVAHYAGEGNAAFGYRIGGSEGPANDVAMTDNVLYNWATSKELDIFNGSTGLMNTGFLVDNSGTNIHGFPDPTRSIKSYDALLGGPGTIENFLKEASEQSKENWRPQYTAAVVNNYIRAGFGKSAERTDPIPPPIEESPSSPPDAPPDDSSPSSPSDDSSSTPDENPSSASVSIQITSPQNGAVINNKGNLDIIVLAGAPGGVSTISILADGRLLKTCSSVTSCTVSWRGKSIVEGTHTIIATAVSNDGKEGNSSVTFSKNVRGKRDTTLSSRATPRLNRLESSPLDRNSIRGRFAKH